jgi:hypothetical protein
MRGPLTTRIDIDNAGCPPWGVMPQTADFRKEFDELRGVKAEALSQWVKAQGFRQQRKVMMKELIAKRFSQATSRGNSASAVKLCRDVDPVIEWSRPEE